MADLKELFKMARELEAGANALILMVRENDLKALGAAMAAVFDGFAELNAAIEAAGVNAGDYPELMTALQRVNQVLEDLEAYYEGRPETGKLN